MLNYKKRSRLLSITLVLSIILITSCGSKKDVVYFQNASSFETLVDKNSFTPKFKVDDLVSIYVSTLDNEASTPFNLYRGVAEGAVRAEPVDYLIDQQGEIDFPVIGKLKISGLSPEETRGIATRPTFRIFKGSYNQY